ncbi:hypothetical protein R1flu_004449 [Riccia fluitans]|uniref:Uncharacterized protein n=1 Tax=Riccia fluitans TaxID=41844 RepID=A0ABD1YQP6_9MARC
MNHLTAATLRKFIEFHSQGGCYSKRWLKREDVFWVQSAVDSDHYPSRFPPVLQDRARFSYQGELDHKLGNVPDCRWFSISDGCLLFGWSQAVICFPIVLTPEGLFCRKLLPLSPGEETNREVTTLSPPAQGSL